MLLNKCYQKVTIALLSLILFLFIRKLSLQGQEGNEEVGPNHDEIKNNTRRVMMTEGDFQVLGWERGSVSRNVRDFIDLDPGWESRNGHILKPWTKGDDRSQTSAPPTTTAEVAAPPTLPLPVYSKKKNEKKNHNNNVFSKTLLIVVPSAPGHLAARNLIRTYWGSECFVTEGCDLVFLLGHSPEPGENDLVRRESFVHGDILQDDFVDSYNNLTVKGLHMLRYFTEEKVKEERRRRKSDYLLKVDEDCYVNVLRIMWRIGILYACYLGRCIN